MDKIDAFSKLIKSMAPKDFDGEVIVAFWFGDAGEIAIDGYMYDAVYDRDGDTPTLTIQAQANFISYVEVNQPFHGNREDINIDFDVYDYVDPTDTINERLSKLDEKLDVVKILNKDEIELIESL
jgi:hypothetical protein